MFLYPGHSGESPSALEERKRAPCERLPTAFQQMLETGIIIGIILKTMCVCMFVCACALVPIALIKSLFFSLLEKRNNT